METLSCLEGGSPITYTGAAVLKGSFGKCGTFSVVRTPYNFSILYTWSLLSVSVRPLVFVYVDTSLE